MSRYRVQGATPIVGGAVFGAALAVLGVGHPVDLIALDAQQRNVGGEQEPGVVIVDIDGRTTRSHGWPIDPGLYAAVLDSLHQAGAKGIGVDVVFGDRSGIAPESDALLGMAARKTETVFATVVRRRGAGVDAEMRATPGAVDTCGSTPDTWAEALRSGIGEVRVAHVEAIAHQSDGVFREMVPCLGVHDGCLPDLASAVARAPAQCGGSVLIPYSRAWTEFPRISMYDIVSRSGEADFQASLRRMVKGRYVLIGPSDRVVSDVGRTPAAHIEPLVAVHANRLQALLEGRAIGRAPRWVIALLGLLLALPATLLRLPVRGWLALSGASAALAGIVSIGAFAASIWVPPLAFALPLGCAMLAGAAHQAWENLRYSQMLTVAFDKYVSPDVLGWLQQTGGAALAPTAAERREIAVLFSDIAGYTRMSNRLPPDQVMASLRLYLDAMITIVQRHGGYLDKINGDGLMVLFGAPRTLDAPSDAAYRCALEMQAEVARLHEAWAEITDGDLAIRIGIATGPAFVGNLGGEGHIEYTAIGPVVNLAARLEPKAPPGGLVMCADTLSALEDEPAGRWVELALKGYDDAMVRGWEVVPPLMDR